VGGQVQVNDTVIVDYSAGVNPIVRPLFIEEEEEELPEGVSAPENMIEEEDISTFQDTYFGGFFGGSYPPLFSGVPHVLEGGTYDYENNSYYQEYFDSANICKNVAHFEDGYMYIPRDGKYIVGMNWLEPFNWNDYQDGSGEPTNFEADCYHRCRILKNNSIVLGMATGQWGIGYYGETSVNLVILEYLEAGDHLSFEVTFTSSCISFYKFDYYGHFEADGRIRWLAYIPGT
jgi:hypothetical protein